MVGVVRLSICGLSPIILLNNMPWDAGHLKACSSGHVSPAGFIVLVITQGSSVWNFLYEFKR